MQLEFQSSSMTRSYADSDSASQSASGSWSGSLAAAKQPGSESGLPVTSEPELEPELLRHIAICARLDCLYASMRHHAFWLPSGLEL